jgi:pyrroline-5-carboxylate reductase
MRQILSRFVSPLWRCSALAQWASQFSPGYSHRVFQPRARYVSQRTPRAAPSSLRASKTSQRCQWKHRADANRLAVQDADIVVLAVKPWMIHDVLHEVANDLKNGATVVSVAAGITLRSMQKIAPEHVTVARAMPNTPSLIGLGVTGLAFADNTPENTRRVVREVFSTVGEVIEVDESQIDALSAISGSGPAYVYWFTEQLTEAAKRLGFTDEDAQTMAENTVVGAANLMNRSEKDPAALRRDVTSPNGTTEQAIHVFADSDFDLTVDEALQAAIRRARELAAE